MKRIWRRERPCKPCKSDIRHIPDHLRASNQTLFWRRRSIMRERREAIACGTKENGIALHKQHPLSAALPRIRPKIHTPFRGSGLKNIALEGGSCGNRIGIAESRATAGLPLPLSRICRRFARFKGAAPSAAPLFWRKAGGRRQTILFPSIQHSAEVNGTELDRRFPLLSPLLGRHAQFCFAMEELGHRATWAYSPHKACRTAQGAAHRMRLGTIFKGWT